MSEPDCSKCELWSCATGCDKEYKRAEQLREKVEELEGQVAMLRDRIVRLHERFTSGPPYTWTMATVIVECEGALSATAKTAEEYRKRVQADLLDELLAKIRADFGATSLFLLMQDMASKLRNPANQAEGKGM